MKLRTDYDSMSNKELFEEMYHRVCTFGDNLSTYVSGGEKVFYKDQTLWLDDMDIRDNSFTLTENYLPDFDNEKYAYKITPFLENGDVNLDYRSLLYQILQGPFTEFVYDEFPGKDVDQQEFLNIHECIVCEEENCIEGHLEIIEDPDVRTPEEWADEMFEFCTRSGEKKLHLKRLHDHIESSKKLTLNDIDWVARSEELRKKTKEYEENEQI